MVQLVEDVILKVFTSCDIYSTLAASQASRYFHTLVFSKQVWSAHISDLRRRFFIDLPHGTRLDDYSTDGLVNLVKRIVDGPSSWMASTDSSSNYPSPTITRQIILKPNIRRGPGILNWENQIQLLPGGAFVFYNNWGKLECWAVEMNNLTWSYRPNRRIDAFAVDVADEGRSALIIIDLRTGTSRRLIDEHAPDIGNSFNLLRLQGDYAIARGYSSQRVMLFKLSTVTVRTFHAPEDNDMDLVSGNLIMVSPDSKRFHKVLDLRLWRMDTLLGVQDGVWLSAIGPQVATSIKLMKSSCDVVFRLAAHLSPLRSGHSVVWVLAYSLNPTFTLIRKYYISHIALDPLTMRCTNSCSLKGVVNGIPGHFLRISYAGYADTSGLYSLANPETKKMYVPLDDRGEYVDLSAYSGALTYATNESLVVNYYK
ncbi:hypothetical protein Hypma_006994 [Hypsizygus marmoreus]|uniref:F-box domain-containing protein n=1 Tax=Hypsizygus marmoreus TaxID=39966 RepID=A0A369K9Y8_HYPMA|nr:hypothetical protein Hypma_006994 [Hypsizygus marmoreus]